VILEDIKENLLHLSLYMTMMNDSIKVEHIINNNSEKIPEYFEVQSMLQSVMKVNPCIGDFNIMTKTERSNTWKFVICGNITCDLDNIGIIENWEESPHFNEKYIFNGTKKMISSFQGPIVDSNLYKNIWGNFLSVYAPLNN
jgi:hypothetical protein